MQHQIIGLTKALAHDTSENMWNKGTKDIVCLSTHLPSCLLQLCDFFPPPPLLSSYLDPSITATFCSLSSCGASGLCHSTYL